MEPWQPVDSLAILKLLALQLASQIDKEVLRERVSGVVPPERLVDILPDSPNSDFVNVSGYDVLPPEEPRDVARVYLHPAAIWPGGSESNAWVAGPSRTESGVSILANDPHLNFSAPTIWYLARIELESGTVTGGTIPGIPMVLSGMSSNLAWGLTAANMDDQDVFIERLNPEDPGEVLTPGGFKPLEVREATINVNGGDPVRIELRWSENGPVIPGKYYNLAQITPEGHVVSIGRTLPDPADTTMSAAHRLLRAKDVFEAIRAMERFVTPAQNLTLADRENIAFQMIGAMPRRMPGHRTLGRLPSEGWIADNRWYGYLPYNTNPRYVNPADGVYGNTNNKTIDATFPHHVSFEWGDTQRIFRLEEALRETMLHTRQGFTDLQLDTESFPARKLVPQLTALIEPTSGLQAEALGLLSGWNYLMDQDRPEPLIYATWMRALQSALADDELGAISPAFLYADPVFLDRVLNDVNGASVWCDDINTDVKETCAQTAAAALLTAVAGLTERHGSDLSSLRWGDVHQATHDNQLLGGFPVVGNIVNIRQSSGGGDHTLLRGLTCGKCIEPLESLHGAVYRAVYDLNAPQESVFVVSTGQSGHPLSLHYRDLGVLWSEGRYVPMLTNPEVLRAEAPGVTKLIPQ